MRTFLATWAGTGVVLLSIAAFVALCYLAGRVFSKIIGDDWGELEVDDKGLNIITATTVSVLLFAVVWLLVYQGGQVAQSFGWL